MSSMPLNAKYRLRLFLLFVLAAAALLLVFPVREYSAAFLQQARQAGPSGPLWLVVLYVLGTLLMVPGSLLTLGAGYVFGVWQAAWAVWLGANIGASLAFLLGRTLARPWVEQRLGNSPRFQALDQAVARDGLKIVLLARLSPLFPFGVLNYGLGLTRVRWRDFVLGSAIGMIPGTLLYVYLGATANSLAELAAGKLEWGIERWTLFLLGLAATVAVTVLLGRGARKALKSVEGASAV